MMHPLQGNYRKMTILGGLSIAFIAASGSALAQQHGLGGAVGGLGGAVGGAVGGLGGAVGGAVGGLGGAAGGAVGGLGGAVGGLGGAVGGVGGSVGGTAGSGVGGAVGGGANSTAGGQGTTAGSSSVASAVGRYTGVDGGDRSAVKKKCASVLASSAYYDTQLVALCRMLAKI